MKLTRRKKWYFIFGAFFCSILLFVSTPASAVTDVLGLLRYYGFQVRGSLEGSCSTPYFNPDQYYYAADVYDWGQYSGFDFCNIQNFVVETTTVRNLGGDFWNTSGQVNLVYHVGLVNYSASGDYTDHNFNTEGIDLIGASFFAGGSSVVTNSTKIDTYDTLWYKDSTWIAGDEYRDYYETLTIYYSANGHGTGTGDGHFRFLIGYPTDSGKWFLRNPDWNHRWYFEKVDQNPTVSFGTAISTALLGTITGNQQTQLNIEDMDRSSTNAIWYEADQDSGSGADRATTLGNLFIGNLVTLVSSLYSVQASNTCYIEPMTFRGYTITQRMDLCSLPVPSSLSAIGTLGCIFILVPFGVHVTRRMLALYEEVVH